MSRIEKKLLKTIEPLINPVVNYTMCKNNLLQEIAQAVLITPEWSEITPPVHLTTKNRFQAVSLGIKCFENSTTDSWSWKLEDGTIIKPEVQVVDEFGNAYDLEGGHAGGSHDSETGVFVAISIGFSMESNKLPKDRSYVKIRIRNEQSFLCPKIYWRDYNLK